MTANSVAIVVAGALVATALLLGLMVDRFQMIGGLTLDGTPSVWRLNTRNGNVSVCVLTRDKNPVGHEIADQYYVYCRPFP